MKINKKPAGIQTHPIANRGRSMIDKPDFLITGLCLLSSVLLPSTLIGKPCENAAQGTKDRPHCLSENKEQLAAILKYHVISGKVSAKDAFRVEDAKTLSGDSIIFSIRDGRLTVNTANVIANDLEASNGVIHVIDSVLMPGVRLQRTP
jgi:uncharacterized surface protein with fasciclin (FAS1) repeats